MFGRPKYRMRAITLALTSALVASLTVPTLAFAGSGTSSESKPDTTYCVNNYVTTAWYTGSSNGYSAIKAWYADSRYTRQAYRGSLLAKVPYYRLTLAQDGVRCDNGNFDAKSTTTGKITLTWSGTSANPAARYAPSTWPWLKAAVANRVLGTSEAWVRSYENTNERILKIQSGTMTDL